VALVNCPDCKADVSREAVACLHCGSPVKEKLDALDAVEAERLAAIEAEKEKERAANATMWIVIGVVLAVLAAIASSHPH
jgi:predicted amidophosphoribosyltransferase